jgi:replication-associated recombination protein RarA
MVQELFTEKFRPRTMEQMILPNRIESLISGGELHQNILLYGPPGTGKTSAAKVICGYNPSSNKYEKYPTLYINVSDETGIDVVREKISMWCSTSSIMDGKENIKVIILDEMDGASDSFYKALRATIEKYAKVARFIGTCNYINKVPEPIQSRFEMVSFDFLNKEEEKEVLIKVIKRTASILSKASITIEKEALIEFVKRNFPDMRKILNKIQSWHIRGIKQVSLEDIKQLNYSYSDIFEILCQKPDAHKNYMFLVANYSSKVDDVLASLGTEFPEYLRENHPEKMGKLPLIIIEVANHQAQRSHVIDPVVTMLSCSFKIQNILNS